MWRILTPRWLVEPEPALNWYCERGRTTYRRINLDWLVGRSSLTSVQQTTPIFEPALRSVGSFGKREDLFANSALSSAPIHSRPPRGRPQLIHGGLLLPPLPVVALRFEPRQGWAVMAMESRTLSGSESSPILQTRQQRNFTGWPKDYPRRKIDPFAALCFETPTGLPSPSRRRRV
jgi:hypothetical protein